MNRRSVLSFLIVFAAAWTLSPKPAAGFTIALDFSSDTATDNFFNSRPLAKAAVQAAANDLNAVLNASTLTAISSSGTPNATDITGTYGSTSVTATWQYDFADPSTGAATSLTTPSIAANTLTIFVGMNKIAGGTLGSGSPSGATLSIGGSGFSSELVNATNAMQSLSNSYMNRGGGPIIGSINDTISFDGSVTASYHLTYGAAVGTLWLDQDTNNDNVNDSLAQLDAFWHYDHTTAVGAGKSDFYSVALHEMMHALGVGASDTWTGLVSGTTWLGSNVKALNGGSGAGLIYSDGAHLASGLMSTNIYTGAAQEVAMDPTLTVGTRKQLTQMDVALLKDLNWQATATVPEPGALILFFSAGIAVILRRRSRQNPPGRGPGRM